MMKNIYSLCLSAFLLVLSSSVCLGQYVKGGGINASAFDLANDTVDDYNLEWPAWVFSHWIWEDEGTRESAEQIMDDYLAHDIPVGAIIIDSPWETDYNTFVYDDSLYPDPQAMVDYFHSKNVKVLMWITGMINTDVQPLYDSIAALDYFMKQNASSGPAVISWWKGDGSLVDLYNPDAVAWWQGMMDNVLDLGIDGWKADGTDYYSLQNSYSPAQGGTVARLDYSHKYYQLFHDYTRQRLGNKRANMSRPIDNYGTLDIGGDFVAFTPKDICYACWVGDQDATFNGLKKALNNMYYSDEYGFLSFGSDIGGYREDNAYPGMGRSKELFIRWAQLGAMSPLMENGGGGEHRPWMFDEETTNIYRRFAKLHTSLIPYLMNNSQTYHDNEEALMSFFNKTNYSFMLGPDIFVAPILAAGGNVTVNFPAGNNWVYLFDESVVKTGGSSEALSFPLTEYPVYIKQGSPYLDSISDPGLLAINTPKAVMEFSLYPNPASNRIMLELPANTTNATAEIFNTHGQLVQQLSISTKHQRIDISGLSAGIYYVSLQSDEAVGVKKFEVVK